MKIELELGKADVIRAFAILGKMDENTIDIVGKYENETFQVTDEDLEENAEEAKLIYAFFVAAKIALAEGLQ